MLRGAVPTQLGTVVRALSPAPPWSEEGDVLYVCLRAAELALRLHGTPPSSHEDLATILATAAAEGLCTDDERVTILRNAVDAGDARIVGGTAPFTYASDGVFTLRGAAIENSRSGRERARVEVRQVTSVAAPGTSARIFTCRASSCARRRVRSAGSST